MGIRILVVDDATFIRDMIKKQLRDKIPGAEIIDAVDGSRAVAAMKNLPPDLILSDWEMPNMSGAELLTHVRAMPHAGTVPFIMISSRGDRSHIIKAIELGVSDYLTKPFTAEELLKKVLKQLKIIGKTPDHSLRNTNTQGIARASVDVLMGGRADSAATPSKKLPANQSASVLMGAAKPASTPSPTASVSPTPQAKPAAASIAKGKAQLRFANNLTCLCVIRELSLQALNGIMQRGERVPGLFEQAVVDIETGDGNNLARVNAYVHSIQAGEGSPDATMIKITVRFVDNDAAKFETLSKYIAQMP